MPGPPRTVSDEEKKRQKAAREKRYRAESVRIGSAISHWKSIRDVNGCKSDEQVAELLLACYYEPYQGRERKKRGLSNIGLTGSTESYKPDAGAIEDEDDDQDYVPPKWNRSMDMKSPADPPMNMILRYEVRDNRRHEEKEDPSTMDPSSEIGFKDNLMVDANGDQTPLPSPERKEHREEQGKDQSLLRECIGEHVTRWNQVKESENLETDMEVADLLLNVFCMIRQYVTKKSPVQDVFTKLQIPGLSRISATEKTSAGVNLYSDVLGESLLERMSARAASVAKHTQDEDSNAQRLQEKKTLTVQEEPLPENNRRRKNVPVRYKDYDYSESMSDDETSSVDVSYNIRPINLPDDAVSFFDRGAQNHESIASHEYVRNTSRDVDASDIKPNIHGLEDETCTLVKVEPVPCEDETREPVTVPSVKPQRKQKQNKKKQKSDKDYKRKQNKKKQESDIDFKRKQSKKKQESDNDYEPTSDTDTEYQYKRFRCDYCDMAFISRPARLKHIFADHPNEKAYKCTRCSEAFFLQQELDNHKLLKLCKENVLQCEICLNKFSCSYSLKVHMDLHEEVAKYSCDKCGARFRLRNGLRRHTIQFHYTGPGFLCQHCGKNFKEKSKLRWHTLSCLNIKNFKCAECGKCFATKRQRTVHMRIHGNQENICEICGKNIRHRGQMKNHLRTHSDEKPFSCSVCEKRFSLKQCLKTHMMVHTQERNHQCSYCQKRFNRPGALRIHILQHTGETPFKCDRCGQGFKQRVLLKRHMVQQHKHELSSEEIAKYKSSTTVQLGIEELVNKPYY